MSHRILPRTPAPAERPQIPGAPKDAPRNEDEALALRRLDTLLPIPKPGAPR